MFVRFRDHIRQEVRDGRRSVLSDARIDSLAWRQAETAIERAIRMEADHGEARSKSRRGEAA